MKTGYGDSEDGLSTAGSNGRWNIRKKEEI